MAQHLPFDSSTNPVVNLTEWNSLLNRGLEKLAVFLVRKNGSYYEAIKGGTSSLAGNIIYGGEDNVGGIDGTSAVDVVNATIAACTAGGTIGFSNDNFTFTDQIIIPTGTRNIKFLGQSGGFGKNWNTQGTLFTSSINADSLMEITTTSDALSAGSLNFHDIRFVGPSTVGSTCLELNNIDSGVITNCSFLNFGKSIVCDFIGVAYPVAEQPGKLQIHTCEFAEAEVSYIELTKNSQCNIHHNIFEGWADFEDAIILTDTNKTYINHNEFDPASTPAGMTSYIRIVSDVEGNYIPTGIEISNNWCYRQTEEAAWIKIEGNQAFAITSVNNLIHHGYAPNEDTDDGYIQIADMTTQQITASDFVHGFSSMLSAYHDNTATWTAGVVRQNLWSPVNIYLTCLMPTNSQVEVFVDPAVGCTKIIGFTTNSSAQDTMLISFKVPSMHYWKVLVNGGGAAATLTGVIGYYE